MSESLAAHDAKVKAEELRRMARLLASKSNIHVCDFLRSDADRIEMEVFDE